MATAEAARSSQASSSSSWSSGTAKVLFVVLAAGVLITVLLAQQQGGPTAGVRTSPPQVEHVGSDRSSSAAPSISDPPPVATETPPPTALDTAIAPAVATPRRLPPVTFASKSTQDAAGPAAVPANLSPASSANVSTARRPVTDFDYQTDTFDTAFPPPTARVQPAIAAHVAAIVKPDAPPVDAVLLFPFASAAWEKDYLPRDILPNTVNGGNFAVRAITVEKWSGGNPSPSKEELTWGSLFGAANNATTTAAGGDAEASPTTTTTAHKKPRDATRRVPVIWAAHLSDGFPTNCPKRVLAKLEYYRPTVILVLSDEHARTWCLHRAIESFRKTLAETGSGTGGAPKLILRQYSKRSSGNLPGNDMRTMPLGYMSGMVLPPNLDRDVLRLASARRLAWAFVGNPKGARKNMVQILSSRIKPFVASAKGGFTPLHMTRVYGDSKFVLSPKGFSRLDCFRIYEASRVGAIPVIVARPTEARIAFDAFVGEKLGALPPWIFANNWLEATKQMQRLLDNTVELDAKQDEVLKWWDRVNFNMRLKIYEALLAESLS